VADRVLVTGATGFIAQHCIVQLLEAGYVVRGTARSSGRTEEIAQTLAPHLSASAKDRLTDLEVVAADLTTDEGWLEAVTDCRFVLHVASPLPRSAAKNDDELVVPARDGTLRVLRAASGAGVKRVVLTSSISAIVYGNDRSKTFDESSWTNLEGKRLGAYDRSKTIAERAAWDFMDTLGANAAMDLVVINPGLVLGPLLSADWGTSGELVKRIIDHDIPAIPDISLAMVDVRDVATAHVRAMTTPDAAGQRFICAEANHSMMEVAVVLRRHLEPLGYKIPTRQLPSIAIRIMALFDSTVRLAMNDLGTKQNVDNARIRSVLQWSPRNLDEMTTSMADSMIRYGVVKSPK
jgi:dihydroflavonol-4-reductase